MDYTSTTLWKAAFSPKNDGYDKLRLSLSQELKQSRENTKGLLDKIIVDFPCLTIHDITHVDGLWQVASVIAGSDYLLNPLEGYVLGIAFLMHDAALSYQAVGGADNLRSTVEWKDFYADNKKDTSKSNQEQLYETDFLAIRFLHAKYAESLPTTLFEKPDGTRFYIIENESLRSHLGNLAGRIAASHHWSIEKVKSLGVQAAAPAGFPQEWRINPIKLACIIRCADAGHIDGNRAPDYLLKLLSINGVSRAHWEAQNRLSQIDIDITDESKVIIESNIDFPECDFAAWNVACDAVMSLNHEIKSSNDLLKSINPQICFKAKSVAGAESRAELSKYIKPDGWMPCDANIHISNVEHLIKSLGGEKLYGSDHKIEVVLRELIQNARDAIVARRALEQGFEGAIHIKIECIDGKYWFSVIDDGIGMSMQTILDYLLNFGNSFWVSDLAKKEYPGLRSSGFNSIGTFGIGFYSLFMVSSEITIDTRKYDSSLDSTIRLKFPSGLCLRPLVSKIKGSSMGVSTIIKFRLDIEKANWSHEYTVKSGYSNVEDFIVPYKAVLSKLTAGLDVNVFFSEPGFDCAMVHKNIYSKDLDVCQWLKDISYADYHEGTKYSDYINHNYNRLTKVMSNGRMIGLAALNTLYQNHSSFLGVTTIGGLDTGVHSSGMEDFIGVIFSDANTAKRDPVSPKKHMIEWMNEQYNTLLKNGLTEADRLFLPYIVGSYGINMTNELFVRVINKGLAMTISLEKLINILEQGNCRLIFPISSYGNDRVNTYIDIERTLKILKDNDYLFHPELNTDFLSLKENDSKCPYNIYMCIKQKATELNRTLNEGIEDNIVYEILSAKHKGFVVSISK